MYLHTLRLSALLATLSLSLFAIACGGGGGGGGGGGSSPEISTLEDGDVAEYCATEENYADNQVTDDDLARAECLGMVLLSAIFGEEDPVAFCFDTFDACVAAGPSDDDDGFTMGEYECRLEEIPRAGCSSTLVQLRNCERATLNEELTLLRDFSCDQLAEFLDAGEEEEIFPPACNTIRDNCPQYYDDDFVPINQTNQNQTNQNQTNQNQTNQNQTNQNQTNQNQTNAHSGGQITVYDGMSSDTVTLPYPDATSFVTYLDNENGELGDSSYREFTVSGATTLEITLTYDIEPGWDEVVVTDLTSGIILYQGSADLNTVNILIPSNQFSIGVVSDASVTYEGWRLEGYLVDP